MKHDPPRLKVEYGTDITIATICNPKILDEAQIAELRQLLDPVIEHNGTARLLLNFENVRFMTSAMLGLLVRVHKNVRQNGGRLEILNLDPNLRKVFEIAQLTKILTIK